MSFAKVMVHYPGGEVAGRRAAITRSVAAWFGAGVIGIAGFTPPPTVGGDLVGEEQDRTTGGAFVEPEQPISIDTGPISRWLSEIGNEFATALGSAVAPEWRSAVQEPTEFMIAQARAADLLVIGPATDS